MKRKDVITLYRKWRRENHRHKPNRAVVKMHWQDEIDTNVPDVIAIGKYDFIVDVPSDDSDILYYVSTLKDLCDLLKPDNGSGFIVDEVTEFYKH